MRNMSKEVIFLITTFIAVVLIISGLVWPVPEPVLRFSEIEKYVGGDAYNMIIASNIRAAEISGTMIFKAILFSLGVLIFVLGLIAYAILSCFTIGNNNMKTTTFESLSAKEITEALKEETS